MCVDWICRLFGTLLGITGSKGRKGMCNEVTQSVKWGVSMCE